MSSPDSAEPSDASKTGGVTPPSIADHRLIRTIGKGSYGEVWLARNVTGIYRAIKVVYQKSFDNSRPFSREFSGIKKFEPVSRTHEGLMDILQIGINDKEGYFYYIMELADDLALGAEINPESYVANTLANQITARGQLPLAECRQLGVALAGALGHLHKKELVHRDVKPSNIIFVQGVPKLADIGLVTDLREAHSFVGTEGYIPPEGPGTTQADLYSLGKLLYEISTGKDRHDFPELPAQLSERPDIDEFLELNEVVVKACHNDASQRYQTAEAMYEDLLLLQAGKSVRRLRLLEKRLRLVGKAAVLILGILLLAGASIFQINREQKRSAEIRQRAVGNYVARGAKYLDEENLLASLPWFVAALQLDRGGLEEETHRLRLHRVLSSAPKITQMYFQSGAINGVECFPGRAQFALACASGEIKLWDLQSGKVVSNFIGHTNEVEKVCFSQDGRWLLSASVDTTARVWDLITGEAVRILPHPFKVNAAQFSSSGDQIVTASGDPLARVWERSTGRLLFSLTNEVKQLWQASFSPDQSYLVVAGDRNASFWQMIDGYPVLKSALKERDWFYAAAFSPDNRFIVTGSYNRNAQVWTVPHGLPVARFGHHTQGVTCAKFSRDGEMIVSGSLDATACLWSPRTGQLLAPPLLHSGRVLDACFGQDSRHIVTVCWDGTARVWELNSLGTSPKFQPGWYSPKGSSCLQKGSNALNIVASTGDRLLSAISPAPPEMNKFYWASDANVFLAILEERIDNQVCEKFQVWNLRGSKQFTRPVPAPVPLRDVALGSDGAQFLTVNENVVQVWDSLTGSAVSPPLHHPSAVSNVFFVQNNNQQVVAVNGRKVYLWPLGVARPSPIILTSRNWIHAVTTSPDGRRIVVCPADDIYTACEAQIFDLGTGQAIGAALAHTDGILSAAFSPDASKVVTASEDQSAIVWDAQTGRQLTTALQHKDQVLSASFSANGRWIVTVSHDQFAHLWDAVTGEPLSPPLAFGEKLAGAQFLEKDRVLLVRKAGGGGWTTELKLETRPVGHLVLLAQLLSGQRGYEPGGLPAANSPSWQQTWELLKSKYGDDLNVPGRKKSD